MIAAYPSLERQGLLRPGMIIMRWGFSDLESAAKKAAKQGGQFSTEIEPFCQMDRPRRRLSTRLALRQLFPVHDLLGES